MEIKNYTSFWNLEKKLYSFYDFQLPVPLSLRVFGVFIVVAVPWALLMWAIRMPITPPWFLIWLAPPVGIAYLCSRPLFEGKNLVEYLGSWLTYLRQNRKYKRLEPDLNKYEANVEIDQTITTHYSQKNLKE